MARYHRTSPYRDPTIRLLGGSACFTEAAIAAGGVWDDVELEGLIYSERDGYSGQFRKMLTGTVPSDDKCKYISDFQKRGALLTWRNHDYWLTLTENLPLPTDYNLTSGFFWSYVEEMFVVTNKTFVTEMSYRSWEDRFDNDEVANAYPFLYLQVHSAYSRHAVTKNLLQPLYVCGLETRLVFSKAICKTPHLYIRWPLLALLYKKLFWDIPSSVPVEYWFPMRLNELPTEIASEEAIARHEGVLLPPNNLVQKINAKYLRDLNSFS